MRALTLVVAAMFGLSGMAQAKKRPDPPKPPSLAGKIYVVEARNQKEGTKQAEIKFLDDESVEIAWLKAKGIEKVPVKLRKLSELYIKVEVPAGQKKKKGVGDFNFTALVQVPKGEIDGTYSFLPENWQATQQMQTTWNYKGKLKAE